MLLLLPLLPLLWAGALAQESLFQLQVQSPVTVQAGLCVSVPCTVSYHPKDWTESDPAYGFWFRKDSEVHRYPPVATNKPGVEVQAETRGRFLLRGDPRNYSCSLDIRNARESDSGRYFYRVERGDLKYSYKAYELTVQVTALTHTPAIRTPGALVSGRPTNLTCSAPWACEGDRPPLFSWTLATHPSLVPGDLSSSVLTLTPRPQDNGASLTCQVTLPGAGATKMTTIHLNVSYPPQNVTVTAFRGNSSAPMALQNGSALPAPEALHLRLVCEADSNPPAELSWTWRSWTLRSLEPGVLDVPGELVGVGGQLTCLARNPHGSLHVSVGLPPTTGSEPITLVVLVAMVEAAAKTLLLLVCLLLLLHHLGKSMRSTGDKEDANAISG